MIDDLKKYYKGRFKQHSYSVEAVQHVSAEQQQMRFALLSRDIQHHDTVVDVGCGFADLLPYLRKVGFVGKYIGLDFVEEFIDTAKAAHEKDHDSVFCVFDVLGHDIIPQCDVAVQSGIFNNALPDGQNWAFVTTCLKKMASASKRSISFNALSTLVEFQDPELYYVDPGEVMKYCHSLMPFVSMRQDYILRENGYPYELTVYASRIPTSNAQTS